MPSRTALTVDCSSPLGNGENDHCIAPGEVLTVTFVNCVGFNLSDVLNKGNAVTAGGTMTSTPIPVSTSLLLVTIDGVAEIEVTEIPGPANQDFVDVFLGYDLNDPPGRLLATQSVVFSSPLSEMTVADIPEFEDPTEWSSRIRVFSSTRPCIDLPDDYLERLLEGASLEGGGSLPDALWTVEKERRKMRHEQVEFGVNNASLASSIEVDSPGHGISHYQNRKSQDTENTAFPLPFPQRTFLAQRALSPKRYS